MSTLSLYGHRKMGWLLLFCLYLIGSGRAGAGQGMSPALQLAGEDGDFYGTTALGGKYKAGILFRFTKEGKLIVLHEFKGATDGLQPGGLIRSKDGNIYGVTGEGGANGGGTVFKMTPNGVLTIVYAFHQGNIKNRNPDGSGPCCLVQHPNGNLYGLAYRFGPSYGGTLFRLDPRTGVFTTLHAFDMFHNPEDAPQPNGGMILGKDGFLYGTSYYGGATGFGAIFKADIETGKVTVLHSCTTQEGNHPLWGVLQGSDGNLYGTTSQSPNGSTAFNESPNGSGTLYRLTMEGKLTTLYSFGSLKDGTSTGYNETGAFPAGLIEETNGDLYGVTGGGGSHRSGTIFKLTPSGKLTTLYTFGTSKQDGNGPQSLLHGKGAYLYGSTMLGGKFGGGTLFKISLDGTLTTLYDFHP